MMYKYQDIEKVTVNGMTMYKLGNRLFLQYSDAVSYVRRSRNESLAVLYGYVDLAYDPVSLAMKGDIIKGIKL